TEHAMQAPDLILGLQSFACLAMRGLDVIRVVWLAVPCFLIGLGAIVATNAGAPTPTLNVGASPEQTPITTDSPHDTLTKADRLGIAYAPVVVEPVVPSTPLSDEI